MSGQILGQAAVGAANTTAQANVQFADQMGDSLMGLAGSLASGYMKKKEMESAVKSGDQMLNMFGDQLGITEDKLKQFNYGEMSLDDKYAFHQNLWGNLGALSNIRIANRNAGIRASAPIIGQNIKDTNTLAEEGPSFDGTSLPRFGTR